jgi:stearoyl-CoA desaturase (delta-9 desaturase)
MVTFGEGWHNNHHAHPVSARHGLAWYELDLNYIGICALKFLGLAKDIKVVNMPQKLKEQEEKLAATGVPIGSKSQPVSA